MSIFLSFPFFFTFAFHFSYFLLQCFLNEIIKFSEMISASRNICQIDEQTIAKFLALFTSRTEITNKRRMLWSLSFGRHCFFVFFYYCIKLYLNEIIHITVPLSLLYFSFRFPLHQHFYWKYHFSSKSGTIILNDDWKFSKATAFIIAINFIEPHRRTDRQFSKTFHQFSKDLHNSSRTLQNYPPLLFSLFSINSLRYYNFIIIIFFIILSLL